MKKNGFTLVEMLVVLFIVSILILITVPNVTKHQSVIKTEGCKAYVKMVQTQVETYELEFGVKPTITDLINNSYIPSATCPSGEALNIVDGNVQVQ
ncbi:MAG: competence protein ComG [Bacillales bacterium]|jgi:competence protein ComGC|nr:competence protein ComG [Bacillales bacterium]